MADMTALRPPLAHQWKSIGPHQGMIYATIGGLQLFLAMRGSWIRWAIFGRRGVPHNPLTARSRKTRRPIYHTGKVRSRT